MLSAIIIAILASSVLGLTGGLIFLWKSEPAKRVSHFLISFAAGAMLAAVFADVLPELLAVGDIERSLWWVLGGIILFYALEQLFIIYHCHGDEHCEIHGGASGLIIIGDTLHNFLDGILIAGSFLISFELGVITATAVLFHELPQEISDFAVLFHNGMAKGKIIFYNILSASASLVGGLGAWFIGRELESVSAFLLPLVAGNFLYIAIADLIPMTRDRRIVHVMAHFIMLLVGVGVMLLVETLVAG